MATANERLLEAAIGHAVDLSRLGNQTVRRLMALLNRIDAELFAQLATALQQLPADSFTVDRLEALLNSTRLLSRQGFDSLAQAASKSMLDLVEYEAGYQRQLFESVVIGVDIIAVSAQQVYTAALARPFQGTLLKESIDWIGESRMGKVRNALRAGYVEGRTTQEMLNQIRGTRAKGYRDGIIEADRLRVETMTLTAMSHYAGFTRDRFHDANKDLIKSVKWLATLDSRTSPECRIRDGLLYRATDEHQPMGHKIPWLGGPGRLHMRCRSVSVPVLKSFAELGLNFEGFGPGERASMDGQVPADLTYGDWLKKQSAKRQDDVLGSVRGALMRDGGLTMERFYNDKGRYLTIDQLRERDARAFKRAGV